MALRKSFVTKFGAAGDYMNIDPQVKNKTTLLIRVNYWKDEATRNTPGAIPFSDAISGGNADRIEGGFKCLYECPYELNSADNVYKQGYSYLKTLPVFDGVVDC